ncbi:MAG: AAA family ATPase [Oscillospiraceae bacterium]
MNIKVRNFGKISSANIDVSNFSIFVGENNSGKSYLMQLIYGVIFSFSNDKKFTEALQDFEEINISENPISIDSSDKGFLLSLQDCINMFLYNNKDRIIKEIFHTKKLKIEELSIELNDLIFNYTLSYEGLSPVVEKDNSQHFETYKITRSDSKTLTIRFFESYPKSLIEGTIKQELLSFILSDNIGVQINSNRKAENNSIIYLPASRSGIMLLYANYLANDLRNNETTSDVVFAEDEKDEVENEYGLTEPVYNFLMFLLKHKASELASKGNKKILSFITNNIINGNLTKVGNSMVYTPNGSEDTLPIYLSSSLVSELAPICQVLTSSIRPNMILYDEIDTCQHPTKQLQLARLLIRMVNAGYKMIVSTHSDTMVAAINNLITMSAKNNKYDLALKLGYDNDDILNNTNVHAYQFIIKQGKTIVEEIPNNILLGIGFDFSLFNSTNDKIYQDAIKLAEED